MSFDQLGRQRIIPRESISISFLRAGHLHIGSQYIDKSKAYLVGQSPRYSDLKYSDHFDLIMVVLTPLGGRTILRFPLDLLYEWYLPIDSLEDFSFSDLEMRVLDTIDYKESIAWIESFFIKRLINLDLSYYQRFEKVL